MKYVYITFLIVLLSQNLMGQKILSKEFLKEEWFSDYYKDEFYNSDTIFLFKILQYKTDYEKLSKEHVILYYSKEKTVEKTIEKLTFEKNGSLHLGKITNVLSGLQSPDEEWKWKFDENLQILYICSYPNLQFAFRVLKKYQEKVKWKVEINKNEIIKIDANILTLKLCRVNNIL